MKRAVKHELAARGLIRNASRRAAWRPLSLAAAAVLIFAIGVRTGGRGGVPADDDTPRFALLLYKGSTETDAVAEAARVAEYAAWADSLARRDLLVAGEKLDDDRGWLLSAAAGGPRVDPIAGNGPDAVSGFFIIRAASEADAIALARSCPHLRHGGRIALRKIVPT